MKYKFSIWERNQLHGLLENSRISGGVSLGQIDTALSAKSKIEYSGEKEDHDIDTEIKLSENEIDFIKQKAFAVQGGWPVDERTKQLKERLQSYAENGAK